MQKSYHISLIKPFYKNNIRNELTKMPKIYFYDNGLRNALLSARDTRDTRIDNGLLIENLFFTQALSYYKEEDIRFWRNKQQKEVDFILEEKKAYEVKANKSKFIPNKYISFSNSYPDIPLLPVDMRDILTEKL